MAGKCVQWQTLMSAKFHFQFLVRVVRYITCCLHQQKVVFWLLWVWESCKMFIIGLHHSALTPTDNMNFLVWLDNAESHTDRMGLDILWGSIQGLQDKQVSSGFSKFLSVRPSECLVSAFISYKFSSFMTIFPFQMTYVRFSSTVGESDSAVWNVLNEKLLYNYYC